MIALTVIITGIIFRPSDFFSYLTEKQTIKYIAYNVIVLFGIVYNIPSIHEGAPINGSLWSLKPELQMYITLLILLVVSRLGRTLARTLTTRLFQVAVVMTFALCVIAGTFTSVKRHELGVLAGMFFGGSTIYILRKHVTLRTIIIISGITIPLFVFSNKISTFSFLMIALPLVTIIAAYTQSNILLAYNQLGDYSYGIYLYAFPIQQILIWSKFIKNPIELMMHALLLSLLFSVLSWHIIEKPVLRLK
jgi:peptidoglycan/LPS O-acetylase OafA/YrhL